MSKFVLRSPFFIGMVVFLVVILSPFTIRAQAKLDVGGYLQSWYIFNDKSQRLETSMGWLPALHTPTSETNGFRLRRARIVAKGKINGTFSATSWIEMAGSSPSLLCFYGEASLRPGFNIRVGQIMMPGQSYDTARNASSWLLFFERPGISKRLSNSMGYNAFRDIGIMAYGQIGRLWYGVHAGNGTGRFQQAGTNITERDFGGGLYGIRVDFELFDGLTLGSHISTNQQRNVIQNGNGPFDIDRTSYSLRLATDGLGIKGLFSQFEYMSLDADDDQLGFLMINDGTFNLHGFYGELGYKITSNWRILARYDEMIEKPRRIGVNAIARRASSSNYTFGISRFIFDDEKELARIHLNYSTGETNPYDLDQSILVLVFQLRFIP